MNSRHVADLISRTPQLSPCADDIVQAFDLLAGAFSGGGKLLLCGNGGSAADAEHWAGELLKGFRSERPLSPEEAPGMPDAARRKLQGGLPSIPLSGFPSATTAFANDCDSDWTFAQLTFALGCPGDVLACISTSGKSRNICNAVVAARARSMHVLALTGIAPNSLAETADAAIAVPEQETYLVQELHLPVYHCLCLMLEDALFDGPG